MWAINHSNLVASKPRRGFLYHLSPAPGIMMSDAGIIILSFTPSEDEDISITFFYF
jgi:hypothetical protein